MFTYILLLCVLELCLIEGIDAGKLDKAARRGRSDELTEENRIELPSSPHYLQRRATTVLYDDFSSGHIDPHKWYYTVGLRGIGHHQFHMLTPEHANSYVKNGILYIKPTLTVDHFGANVFQNGDVNANALWGKCTNPPCHLHGKDIAPTMSAMLRSYAHIKYGKVEIVAKLAKGDWLWNALWMMPTKPTAYGGWPRSGEIDITECPGNRHLNHRDGAVGGILRPFSTIHYGVSRDHEKTHHGDYALTGSRNFGDDFHRYWVDWNEDHLRTGIDDHVLNAVPTPAHGFFQSGHFPSPNIWSSGGKNAPFDQPFFLIMNVAVGGSLFHEEWVNHPYPKPWTNDAADELQQFWAARHLWYPTWRGEEAALKIRSVKMQEYN